MGEAINTVERFCEEIARELDFLTATAKIPFVYTAQSKVFEHYMQVHEKGIKNPIQIEIDAAATKGTGVVALSGRVFAKNYYSRAVQSEPDREGPEQYPKSGDLILWSSSSVIGTGSPESLPRAVADPLKGQVKEFITLYIKYHKPIQ